MIAVGPLHAAISVHRDAYDAFQVAPEGEDSELASCEMLDALDALVQAACAFPILGRSLPEGASALLAHLQWWLTDEAVNAADYQPNYGILLGRATDLAAVLERGDYPLPQSGERKGAASGAYPTARQDPIFSLIEAADAKAAAHTVACRDLFEDDDEKMRSCNQAAEDAHAALAAVRLAMPVSVEGLHALASFYVRDADLYGRDRESLGHLAQALLACDSTGRFSGVLRPETVSEQPLAVAIPPGEKPAAPAVPDQAQVAAAWRALPAEMRDRIGIIATDMTFQSFVSGDGYGPKDRSVPGWSKRAQTIRGEAGDACCHRLTELHNVVEAAIPQLFGPDGQNPDWAVAMGARR